MWFQLYQRKEWTKSYGRQNWMVFSTFLETLSSEKLFFFFVWISVNREVNLAWIVCFEMLSGDRFHSSVSLRFYLLRFLWNFMGMELKYSMYVNFLLSKLISFTFPIFIHLTLFLQKLPIFHLHAVIFVSFKTHFFCSTNRTNIYSKPNKKLALLFIYLFSYIFIFFIFATTSLNPLFSVFAIGCKYIWLVIR